MNFSRTLTGLALGAIATLASPAFAARFEVTYTTTFDSVLSTVDCGGCGQSPTTTQSPLDPVSLTSTVVFDIQAALIEPTRVLTYEGPDVDGRSLKLLNGTQLMSFTVNSNVAWTSFVPQSLLDGAGVTTPSLGTEILGVTRSRFSSVYADDPTSLTETDSWGFYRHLSWTAQDGTSVRATSSMFQSMPFPVTFESVGVSLTEGQFVQRMLQDFWCTGCSNRTEAQLMASLNGVSRTDTYQGSVTAFSIRDLNAAVVPEPSTYALMLAGVVLVGAAARRRRQGDGAIRS